MVDKYLTKYEYKDYIQSDGWQNTRKRYRESKLQKSCYCCGTDGEVLDLHHKSYKTLGNENLTHLCRLCRYCHTMVHELAKRKGISIWEATKKWKRLHPGL